MKFLSVLWMKASTRPAAHAWWHIDAVCERHEVNEGAEEGEQQRTHLCDGVGACPCLDAVGIVDDMACPNHNNKQRVV